MPRKNDPEQTISKILDTASELFVQRGYEQTTMQNIVDGLGMSKGAIFHHFKSKEDVLEAVIERMIEGIVVRVNEIANDPTLRADQKIQGALETMNVTGGAGGEVIAELHRPANAQMHQITLEKTVHGLVPILARIVEQGIAEGLYHVEYVTQTLEFLFAANQVIFDNGLFLWNEEEMLAHALAFVQIIESSLGAAKGSFGFLVDGMGTQHRGQ